ncbi:MAG: DUF2635 domain-containing protein [Burkholderiaceae bacterium]|jgi:hypothetical protein|nr:DUF2635 domain-containing protein [Burkholderiaceae bacterium]
MKVYPVKGRLVRDPITGREFNNTGGLEVSDTDPFWLRRLADGDVSRTADQNKQEDE